MEHVKLTGFVVRVEKLRVFSEVREPTYLFAALYDSWLTKFKGNFSVLGGNVGLLDGFMRIKVTIDKKQNAQKMELVPSKTAC